MASLVFVWSHVFTLYVFPVFDTTRMGQIDGLIELGHCFCQVLPVMNLFIMMMFQNVHLKAMFVIAIPALFPCGKHTAVRRYNYALPHSP